MQGENYKVTISEASKELSGKEKVAIKNTTDCVKLDQIADTNGVIIDVAYYVVLDIHNENSESKDYKNYILVDTDGTKYVTGSNTFFTTFSDMWSDMLDCDEEWKLKVMKKESKNYKGKYFLTCAIL